MMYKSRVEALKEEMVKSLVDLIRIPSVKGQATVKYPFGEAIDQALVKTLEICESLGFRTHYDQGGYYGYAEIGEGEEMLGILGHLDVVPPGERANWDFEPFGGEVKQGRIYGRGTQDDKGPTIAAIYAAKALMDSGVTLNRRIRFIFGTDEENLWGGIEKYMANEEIPTFGFTPDADFPLIYAEKGLLQILLKSKNPSQISVQGGNAFNAVPDKIRYRDKRVKEVAQALEKLNFDYKEEGSSLVVYGKGAHASKPEHGINAIERLALALNDVGLVSGALKFIAEVIGEDYHGKNIFGECEDKPSGKLTINIGQIKVNSEGEEISVDIRIPVTIDKEDIVDQLKIKAADYGLTYEEYDYLEALYVPQDHVLIKTLRGVYEKETGLDSTPLSTGGGTYARSMDNCVAFGPVFPGQEKVEHQANEYIEIEKLLEVSKIYASAIHELAK